MSASVQNDLFPQEPSTKTKKAILLFSVLTTTGSTVADICFAIPGLILFLACPGAPNLDIIAAASCSAGATIESEVFFQNHREAFSYSLLDRFVRLRHKIIQNWLIDKYNAYLEAKEFIPKFLTVYAEHYCEWQKLHRVHGHDKNPDQQTLENELAYRLYQMENAIWQFDPTITNKNDETPSFVTTKDKIELTTRFENKKKQIYLSCCLIPFAMVGSFFCTFYMAHEVFTESALQLTASGDIMTVALTFASIAAVAWGLMIYRTLMQMIYDDLLKEYWLDFKKSFNKGTLQKKSELLLTAFLTTALIVLLTFFTAGTWWKAGAPGFALLFNSAVCLSQIMTGIFISIHILAGSIFNSKNILQSIDKLKETSFKDKCIEMYDKYMDPLRENKDKFLIKYQEKKSRAQFAWTPIYALAFMLRATTHTLFFLWTKVFFVGHCVTEGATVDNSFELPSIPNDILAQIAAPTKAAQEAAADYHCFEGNNHKTKNEKEQSTTELTPLKKESFDSHRHSNIPQKVLCIIISPILLVNALLHYWLTHDNWESAVKTNFKEYWSHPEHTVPAIKPLEKLPTLGLFNSTKKDDDTKNNECGDAHVIAATT